MISHTYLAYNDCLTDEKSKAHFTEIFCNCPAKLSADPHKTLPPAIWQTFLDFPLPTAKNFWIETSDGLGRIGANISTTNFEIGYLGFFEMAHPQVGTELLQKAINWLKQQGAKQIYGPINFNTWFPYRFADTTKNSTGTHAELNFSWEPQQPPIYLSTWINAGFAPDTYYHSQGLSPLSEFQQQVLPAYQSACSQGFSFRAFDSDKLETEEIQKLYRLSMQGFADNYLFEAISENAFRSIYVPIMRKADLRCCYWALDREQNEVGFFFGFIENGYLILKSAALLKSARGHGLSNALASLVATAALNQGVNRFVTALMKKGAQSESFGKKTAELWNHNYVLLKLGNTHAQI